MSLNVPNSRWNVVSTERFTFYQHTIFSWANQGFPSSQSAVSSSPTVTSPSLHKGPALRWQTQVNCSISKYCTHKCSVGNIFLSETPHHNKGENQVDRSWVKSWVSVKKPATNLLFSSHYWHTICLWIGTMSLESQQFMYFISWFWKTSRNASSL